MTTTEHETAIAHREEHAHPGPRTYVYVALWLAGFTAVEVFLSYIPSIFNVDVNDVRGAIIAGLVVLMIAKFSGVVLWFMHLRFDPAMFSVMFVGGLALAVVVFTAVLAIQRVLFA